MKFVFDFGSVLFRWRPRELMRRALPNRATDDASADLWVAEVFQGFGGDWGEFDRGTIEPGALQSRIAMRSGLTPLEVRRVLDEIPHELTPIPESVRLLERLRGAGRPMFYLSNMPAPYADHLERVHEFVRRFDDGVFSARVRLIKPDAAIFRLSQARFGVPADELVFLDDNLHNIQAARAAGWNAVHFTGASQAEADLRRSGWWPDGVA